MKFVLVSSALVLAGCQTTTAYQGPARVLLPVQVCEDINEPIYGVLDRPSSTMEIISGAVIGGAIGNQFGNGEGKDVMTIIGALVGASGAANTRQQEQIVVGYNKVNKCRTIYQ